MPPLRERSGIINGNYGYIGDQFQTSREALAHGNRVAEEVGLSYNRIRAARLADPAGTARDFSTYALQSPAHLGTAFAVVMGDLFPDSPTETQKFARSVLGHFLRDISYTLESLPRDQKFLNCATIIPAIAASISVNSGRFSDDVEGFMHKFFLREWDTEGKIAIVLDTYTVIHNLEGLSPHQQRRTISKTSSRFENQMMNETLNATRKITAGTRKNQFDEATLRAAVVCSDPSIPFFISDTKTKEQADIKDTGIEFLSAFYRHFNQNGEFATGLMHIAEALARSLPPTKKLLAGYLVDNTWDTKFQVLGGQTEIRRENLSALLKKTLNGLGTDNTQERRALERFFEATTMLTPEGDIANNLYIPICQSSRYTSQEKSIFVKEYLSFLIRYNLSFDMNLLSPLHLENIANGTWNIYWPQYQEGEQIIIRETGEVIGTIKGNPINDTNDDENQEHPNDQETTAAAPDTMGVASLETDREKLPAHFDFFETIPYIGTDNLIDTPPNKIPDPAHYHHDWHFFEAIAPLFETKEAITKQQIQTILAEANIRPDLPDHVIEAYDLSLAEIGADIPIPSTMRTKTLSPKGNMVHFIETPLATDTDTFPRVYFTHDEPQRINGTQTSDIFGTLFLAPNIQYNFFLDNNGHPQGDIDRLYNENLVSWPQIWQIKYRLTALTHKLLIIPEEEVQRRRNALAKRANHETGTGKGNGHSDRKLAEKVAEGQRYFDDDYWQWSMEPVEDTEEKKPTRTGALSKDLDEKEEAACLRVIAEMETKHESTRTLYRKLDRDEMYLALKQARSKGHGVKTDYKTGHPMFMNNGRRPSVQNVENGIRLGVGYYVVIEITKDQGGSYQIVVSRSGLAADPIKQIPQHAVA